MHTFWMFLNDFYCWLLGVGLNFLLSSVDIEAKGFSPQMVSLRTFDYDLFSVFTLVTDGYKLLVF